MIYRPEIDGMRAVAVVPVILYHAGLNIFSGGFVGVDIFFVISGYLITSIILEELSEGNFKLTEFYERRARRLLPALFFMMAISIPFAWMWMLPAELKLYSQNNIYLAQIVFCLLYFFLYPVLYLCIENFHLKQMIVSLR